MRSLQGLNEIKRELCSLRRLAHSAYSADVSRSSYDGVLVPCLGT